MPEETAPSTIRDLPSWLLGRAAARGRGLVADALAERGLKMWHHVVLSAVADLQPVAQADLVRSVQLDPKDMVGVLNDLQAAGLVERTPDPKDRRKNAVTITDGGVRLVRDCARAARVANDELLAPLGAAERTAFLAMLRRVVEAP
ncbi:MarR family winged helix-turn-helix transcriptional regulator [Streptomyces sp. VRA16 Mangrove soil]|uniref:MarR family winged helix-turn-helix transcriptional regulator n=1 Tax=Streptomyces sp. VRA16 Mangrove soil TaxID=2817434 RepID=UPI001A9CF1F1|nr:MarR family winged helix-turn-helix transcriptional regulator [Streptomyces sp. VRA16 Mangrove soil]MBO1331033.1 winged helix-turn-helix transcriptional regulator [Streptomyces sp. VRA16 Mangrove soil]